MVLAAGTASGSARVSFEVFHTSLEPHGTWHDSSRLGRVWRPQAYHAGWHPYRRGHWVYTEYGWTWASAHDWGAIPYHYGTWVLEPELGWVWVPGYVWAPSWVVFRAGPSYVGWAPVPPGYAVGASVDLRAYDAHHFVVVQGGDFLAERIELHALPPPRARQVLGSTRIVNSLSIENDVVVSHGLDPKRVARFAKHAVRQVPIERVERVAPGGRLERGLLRVDPRRVDRGAVKAIGGAKGARTDPRNHPEWARGAGKGRR
jgi:hypothetical protein